MRHLQVKVYQLLPKKGRSRPHTKRLFSLEKQPSLLTLPLLRVVLLVLTPKLSTHPGGCQSVLKQESYSNGWGEGLEKRLVKDPSSALPTYCARLNDDGWVTQRPRLGQLLHPGERRR